MIISTQIIFHACTACVQESILLCYTNQECKNSRIGRNKGPDSALVLTFGQSCLECALHSKRGQTQAESKSLLVTTRRINLSIYCTNQVNVQCASHQIEGNDRGWPQLEYIFFVGIISRSWLTFGSSDFAMAVTHCSASGVAALEGMDGTSNRYLHHKTLRLVNF